jgi:hypothetical protein
MRRMSRHGSAERRDGSITLLAVWSRPQGARAARSVDAVVQALRPADVMILCLILAWLLCGIVIGGQAPPPPDPEFDEDWP